MVAGLAQDRGEQEGLRGSLLGARGHPGSWRQRHSITAGRPPELRSSPSSHLWLLPGYQMGGGWLLACLGPSAFLKTED